MKPRGTSRVLELKIIPDDEQQNRRFFLRDPGGNLIEVAEAKTS